MNDQTTFPLQKNSTQIFITLGTGGVGKTSLSAALGAHLALNNKKTLVITIDPAQRLKTTLGVTNDSGNYQVNHPDLNGYLWASLLNSKLIFDNFARKGLKNEILIEKLFKNRLYIQLSTHLSGSQEFTSLEKLLVEYESGQWDYIVLDTPPSGHAIEFLKAPEKLNRLLDEKIAKWFRDPKQGGTFFGQLLQRGTKNLLKALELLTGSEFMTELSDFFDQIQFWQEKLGVRLKKVQTLLTNSHCQFILVANQDLAKLKESLDLITQLNAQSKHVSKIIINKSKPYLLNLDFNSALCPELEPFIKKNQALYFNQSTTTKNLFPSSIDLIEIPEAPTPVSNVDDIISLSSSFIGGHFL